ncbi:MAG: hypothetical protein ACRC1K_21360, partial [Planctomycetia bacterium]
MREFYSFGFGFARPHGDFLQQNRELSFVCSDDAAVPSNMGGDAWLMTLRVSRRFSNSETFRSECPGGQQAEGASLGDEIDLTELERQLLMAAAV